MYYLSHGNMAMKDILIWSLPAKTTCPMSTPLCRKSCYALKAERCWANSLSCRKENLESTMEKQYVENMVTVIKAELLRSKKPITHFRIHESGDFYTQQYLDAWKAICSYFNNLKFLAFTKSFHLDFDIRPKNLQFVMSVWEDSNFDKIPKGFPISFTGLKGWNAIKCSGGEDKCNHCGFKCWDLSKLGKNVWSLIH